MSANRQNPSDRIVLVAIPDEWRIEVQQLLQQNGYSVVAAASEDEARVILQERRLNGAIIISDWAIAHEGGKAGLLPLAKGRIPTVCLVTERTWREARERWFGELFHPPMHEYCSMPTAADELLTRLNAVISTAETGT